MPIVTRGCVVLLLMSLSACGGTSPPSPSTPSLTGTWAGTTDDNLVGVEQFRATISQSGSSLSGTWTGTTEANSLNGNNGTLSGGVNGASVSLTLTPSPAICPFNVTATVSGNDVTGTYSFAASPSCVPVTGSITLTRQ